MYCAVFRDFDFDFRNSNSLEFLFHRNSESWFEFEKFSKLEFSGIFILSKILSLGSSLNFSSHYLLDQNYRETGSTSLDRFQKIPKPTLNHLFKTNHYYT